MMDSIYPCVFMIYYSVVLDGMWEKELIIGIHWEKENLNSQQASFSTRMVGPQAGIFLSPLYTN